MIAIQPLAVGGDSVLHRALTMLLRLRVIQREERGEGILEIGFYVCRPVGLSSVTR